MIENTKYCEGMYEKKALSEITDNKQFDFLIKCTFCIMGQQVNFFSKMQV